MSVVAKRIDRYLRGHGSPLAGLGSVIEAAGRRHGVDPYLLVAIAGAETSLGTDPNAHPDIAHHNAWGWGPHIKFGSWAQAIDTIAPASGAATSTQGRTTIPQIQRSGRPPRTNDPTGLNSNWTKNVTRFYSEVAGGKAPKATAPRMPAALAPLAPAKATPAAAAAPPGGGASWIRSC
jgi:hypothetical protein